MRSGSGSAALEPTQVLSNGRYSVLLRANGAGSSSWEQTSITRTRDDALRDERGSFLYLRRHPLAPTYSITQHPAPDPVAHYQSVFHADRVCSDAVWPDLQAHTTVWVSPEDDIEFRQVEAAQSSELPQDIELISAFEVSLADTRADEAHPVFMNLLVPNGKPPTRPCCFERKPRIPPEQGTPAGAFSDRRQQTGRRGAVSRPPVWSGRNHTPLQPLAGFLADPMGFER